MTSTSGSHHSAFILSLSFCMILFSNKAKNFLQLSIETPLLCHVFTKYSIVCWRLCCECLSDSFLAGMIMPSYLRSQDFDSVQPWSRNTACNVHNNPCIMVGKTSHILSMYVSAKFIVMEKLGSNAKKCKDMSSILQKISLLKSWPCTNLTTIEFP